MRALLDVNFLIALTDTDHEFHVTAKTWMVNHHAAGWATCPLTQNGCVRIMSQPAYRNSAPLRDVLARLAAICAMPIHEFWPDDASLLDATQFDHAKIHGHRKLTDLYLLGLAVKHNGRLVTFDGQMALSAVRGAQKKHLVVL